MEDKDTKEIEKTQALAQAEDAELPENADSSKDEAPKSEVEEPKEVRGATILTMSELDLVGVTERVSSKKQTNFIDIEAFIKQKTEDGTIDALKAMAVPDENGRKALYGVSLNFDKDEYDYFLGVESKETPKEMSKINSMTVAESAYARFTAKGAAPDSIKACWKKIYNEWFGTVPYNHSGAPELEEWDSECPRDAQDASINVYVPVKRIIKKPQENRPNILPYVIGGGLGLLTGSVIGNAAGDMRMGILIGLIGGLVLGGVAKKIMEERFKR